LQISSKDTNIVFNIKITNYLLGDSMLEDAFSNENEEEYYEFLENYQNAPTTSKIFREWATINGLRDALGLALKGTKTVTYPEIVAFGASLAPAILGPDRLLFKNKISSALYQEYEERATALSEQEKKEVSVIEAVKRGIEELQKLIHAGKEKNLATLRRRLKQLSDLYAELAESRHTENNLIIRDVYKVERNLPFEDRKEYRDFKIDEDRGLRIRVLHPDHLEHITGADLVYECYWEQEKKVRVAAIQYKIRRSKAIYIDERIENQLSRLEETFCNGKFCHLTNDENKKAYRLPYCSAFLRPTNEIQVNDPRIMSKGYYVPICIVKEVRESTDNQNVLPSNRLRSQAITHKIFEELFNANMLGSQRRSYNELEEIYKSTGLLEEKQSITIYAQEFSLTSKSRKRMNSSRTRQGSTVPSEEATDDDPLF
jgi:predicted DNA-binding protein